ncbi:MAG: FISUMP domain-containing protein, partial [Bacteroidales bacterium]|nr:FISUMP domain-containing protein [Bacteroidales bacterium]
MKTNIFLSTMLMLLLIGSINTQSLAWSLDETMGKIGLPSVTTTAATLVTPTSAIIGGNVTSDGGSAVTECGVFWGLAPNPEFTGTKVAVGSGLGNFTTTLSGLDPAKTYYYKAYATNSTGSAFGIERLFPLCPLIVADADGNVYNTVNFGSQCWIGENLKTTKYRNGSPIPNLDNASQWSNDLNGAYVWYENAASWKDKYGALYNWYAVNNANGLCPIGWKVPAMDDMIIAYSILGGGLEVAGKKMKSCRTVNSPLGGACATIIHPCWEENNLYYGTDDFGAAALPGGFRNSDGAFFMLGYIA